MKYVVLVLALLFAPFAVSSVDASETVGFEVIAGFNGYTYDVGVFGDAYMHDDPSEEWFLLTLRFRVNAGPWIYEAEAGIITTLESSTNINVEENSYSSPHYRCHFESYLGDFDQFDILKVEAILYHITDGELDRHTVVGYVHNFAN